MTRLTPGRLAVAIGLLAFSGGIAAVYAPQTVINRLATTRSEVQGGTLNGRLGIWKAGLTALLARPVTGHGVGGFQEAVQPFLGEARVAHNSYISVLVEEGLIGFVLFMAMLFTVFRSILDLPTMDRRFALALYCTMGITMLPLSWEAQKAVWFVLAALEGLARAQGLIDPGAAWRQRFRRVAVAPAAPRTARAREPLAGPIRRAGADGAA
jgi:O-antigen ligase